MLAGIGLYFLETMAAAVADLMHLDTLAGFTGRLPAVVIGHCNNIIVENLPDLAGIWKYAWTAAGITAVCSVIGYLYFRRSEHL